MKADALKTPGMVSVYVTEPVLSKGFEDLKKGEDYALESWELTIANLKRISKENHSQIYLYTSEKASYADLWFVNGVLYMDQITNQGLYNTAL